MVRYGSTISFYTVELKVTPDVLIPRPETEIMVDELIKRLSDDSVKIADIGTGSGAIAIALADNLPYAQIVATDISKAALQIAQQNAKNNHVADRISFFEGDLLNPLNSHKISELDVIVSNPPHIAIEDKEFLAPEVRNFEPEIALFSEKSGTYHHQKLIKEAWKYLKPKAILAMEVGMGQSSYLQNIVEKNQHYSEVVIMPDYAGIDRVLIAKSF